MGGTREQSEYMKNPKTYFTLLAKCTEVKSDIP